MTNCQSDACDNPATAQGLCSLHYQERRRREKGLRTVRGPAPKYPEQLRKHGGAPHFNLRLEPNLFDWVTERGGVAWVRQVLSQLMLHRSVTVDEPDIGHPQAATSGKAAARRFLEALHAGTILLTGKPHGVMVKLLDLYDVLTVLPYARKHYTLDDFAADVYLLDHYPDIRPKEGLHWRLDAGSTAAKKRTNLLVATDKDGRPRDYYAIEFMGATTAPSDTVPDGRHTMHQHTAATGVSKYG